MKIAVCFLAIVVVAVMAERCDHVSDCSHVSCDSGWIHDCRHDTCTCTSGCTTQSDCNSGNCDRGDEHCVDGRCRCL